MNEEIYLDNNATTRPLPAVVEAMMQALGPAFGNPSSAHSAGERARRLLESSREAVAELIGADPGQVIFTSGGTEGNNTCLFSVLRLPPERRRIVTTAVEHSSVVKACERLQALGVAVTTVAVDSGGRVSLAELEESLRGSVGLVSIQWVNSETGVIQPVEDVARLCAESGALFHTDAAQAVGKLSVDVSSIPVDFLTFTGHKLHAPQGVGALYCRNRRSLLPTLWGGGQEGGVRPGTENLVGIAGLGKAAKLRRVGLKGVQAMLSALRDAFEESVRGALPDVRINGDRTHRVCNTTNLRFPGTDGQALVARLDAAGVRCSQSSACTNMRPEPSYVLRAMGLSAEEAYESARFSFAETTTALEAVKGAQEVAKAVKFLQGVRNRLSVLASRDN